MSNTIVLDRNELRTFKYTSAFADLSADQVAALLWLVGEVSLRVNAEGDVVGGNIERGKAALAALVRFSSEPLSVEQVRAAMREASRR